MTTEPKNSEPERVAYNYCVSFVDLLGQRDALQGQGLLIQPQTEDDRKAFHSIFKNSIGAITALQERAEAMLEPLLNPDPNSSQRASLPPEQRTTWDEMMRTHLTTQRWSDGLVSFACLGDANVKCKVNGVSAIFYLAGALCLVGLATGHPIRGAIEIAWGVELHPGELYGPAVARAYELESEVAQYPRIVVGPETVRFLQAHAANTAEDVFSQTDREWASRCLDMLVQDADGHWLLHYLGEKFQFAVTRGQHEELYKDARQFVQDQLALHQHRQNSKLAFRYSHLLLYFNAHPPAVPR